MSSAHHASIMDGIFQSCALDNVKKMHDELRIKLESTEDQIMQTFTKDIDGWMLFVNTLNQLQNEIQEYIKLEQRSRALTQPDSSKANASSS